MKPQYCMWRFGLVAGAALSAAAPLHGQSCQPYWASATMDLAIQPRNLFAFDDGSGSALYASGVFSFTGPPYTYTVARWQGHVWKLLSAGLPQPQPGIEPAGPWMCVLDDGSGPAIFAFGYFSNYPSPGTTFWSAKWSGSAWTPGPAGLMTSMAAPAAQFRVGGASSILGLHYNGSQRKIVRWVGGAWNAVVGDPGASGYVTSLKAIGEGPGAILVAIGGFTSMNGVPARGIATWNGASWSGLGSGVGMDVRDVALYDDGTGPAIYVVGAGSEAGGTPVHNIAKWDGARWSDVGGGTSACASCPSILYAAQVFDDGRGPALYVTGYVSLAGGVPVHGIARWDGTSWSAVGAGINGSYADFLAVYDDGRGPSLFVADTYSAGAGVPHGIAQWVGCPNCYANCDNSSSLPRLNVNDFICFLTKYAAKDPYANCNVDAGIDINDFNCFLNKFAAGCP